MESLSTNNEVINLLSSAIQAEFAESLPDLSNPNWDAARWSWEFYVPKPIREAWAGLSVESQLVAIYHALDRLNQDEPRGRD